MSVPVLGSKNRPQDITQGGAMFFLQEGFTYRNFSMDMIAIFVFVVWF
jgi:hypothetical protein